MLRSCLMRRACVGAAVAALTFTAPSAHAEADTFGVGNGHSGAKTAANAEVVNAYARIAQNVAAGGSQIQIGAVLGAAGGFANGDLVLVWRATGAIIADAQAPAIADRFTTHVDLATASAGKVGVYEFARVTTVSGSTLNLSAPLVHAFDKDVTQVVKVPEYTTVSVPTGMSLAALPWTASDTGFAGGMLVFLANNTVTLTGTGKLSADAAGFRGGVKVQRLLNLPLGCANDDGAPADGYANKGEGVVNTEFGAAKGGRGNWSLAAGGGNCVETGGGGGANAGAGGVGGDSVTTSGRGGRGGVPLDYSLLQHLTMGGGGGAGEQKNGVGSSGGAGGGVVFVRAKALAGTGTITALGEAAENAGILGVESDGAGGGGAGGSIIVRATGDATCGGLTAGGGKGGDTAVVGVGFWGPGGGGGGGRVLLQANTKSGSCTASVTAGNSGASGSSARGATGGQGGSTQPASGPFCFSNPTVPANAQCADPTPVCDIPNGSCTKCGGPFGGGNPLACPVANEPVCMTTGACVPCNGDLGTSTTQHCQLGSAPTCLAAAHAGECGKCTGNTDCQGAGHAGPICNTTAGACGNGCTTDSDCAGTEWCAQSVCIAKTPNSQPVPNITPVNGECTDANGKRTCLSGVCEQDDDLCGKHNGTPCGVPDECRSAICFPADKLCGKPIGEPCAGNEECRSDLCEGGICSEPCGADTDCPVGKICEAQQCVAGCRIVTGDAGTPDGGRVNGGCPDGQHCAPADGGGNQCVPNGALDGGRDGAATDSGAVDSGANNVDGSSADAGDPFGAGIVEGGGCACHAGLTGGDSPAALGALASLAALIARRRKNRSLSTRSSSRSED